MEENKEEVLEETPLEQEDKKCEKKHKKKKDCKCEENVQKIKDLEEALLRKDADMINYRKRKDDEVVRMLKYSNEDIAKDLLPIVDNFERAISLDDDNLDDELSKFLEGFKMIYCHLTDVLNKFEVKAIDGNKKPFDPNFHQAVLTEKVPGMEPGMVIEVLQKGYLLKDKVIRVAMVKVSE
ncbi:MAG: nucleotide exchange factor GrpE [Bacilli bacterium]|nr:nucleotide exchange factor GrpE [Bacilli bacterium]